MPQNLIKTILPIFLLVFGLLFSCQKQPATSESKEKNNESEVITDTLTYLMEAPSPAGFIFGEYWASDNNHYIFCNDSVFINWFQYYEASWTMGKWQLRNDSIIIHYTKEAGKRGIGETIMVENVGNAPEKYGKYVDFVEHIDRKEVLLWSEVKQAIQEDPEYPYQILDIRITCDPAEYDLTLPGDYPLASYKRLTEGDLMEYSKDQLRLIRNEIFARYGYQFKSEELKNHFGQKDWYKPENEDVSEYLTEIERANLDLIKSME